MNDQEIKSMLNIMLSSTEKQMKEATSDTMKMYLEGYQAAIQLMIEYVERK